MAISSGTAALRELLTARRDEYLRQLDAERDAACAALASRAERMGRTVRALVKQRLKGLEAQRRALEAVAAEPEGAAAALEHAGEWYEDDEGVTTGGSAASNAGVSAVSAVSSSLAGSSVLMAADPAIVAVGVPTVQTPTLQHTQAQVQTLVHQQQQQQRMHRQRAPTQASPAASPPHSPPQRARAEAASAVAAAAAVAAARAQAHEEAAKGLSHSHAQAVARGVASEGPTAARTAAPAEGGESVRNAAALRDYVREAMRLGGWPEVEKALMQWHGKADAHVRGLLAQLGEARQVAGASAAGAARALSEAGSAHSVRAAAEHAAASAMGQSRGLEMRCLALEQQVLEARAAAGGLQVEMTRRETERVAMVAQIEQLRTTNASLVAGVATLNPLPLPAVSSHAAVVAHRAARLATMTAAAGEAGLARARAIRARAEADLAAVRSPGGGDGGEARAARRAVGRAEAAAARTEAVRDELRAGLLAEGIAEADADAAAAAGVEHALANLDAGAPSRSPAASPRRHRAANLIIDTPFQQALETYSSQILLQATGRTALWFCDGAEGCGGGGSGGAMLLQRWSGTRATRDEFSQAVAERSTLRHPSLPKLVAAYCDDGDGGGVCGVALELGCPLAELCTLGQWCSARHEPGEVIDFFRALLQGVAYLHHRGSVAGEALSPTGVAIRGGAQPLLVAIDVPGMTKRRRAGAQKGSGALSFMAMTMGGEVEGNNKTDSAGAPVAPAPFRAPECGSGAVATTASDLYSIGSLMYWAAFSALPPTGAAAGAVPAHADEALAAAIRALVAPRAADRPVSADAALAFEVFAADAVARGRARLPRSVSAKWKNRAMRERGRALAASYSRGPLLVALDVQPSGLVPSLLAHMARLKPGELVCPWELVDDDAGEPHELPHVLATFIAELLQLDPVEGELFESDATGDLVPAEETLEGGLAVFGRVGQVMAKACLEGAAVPEAAALSLSIFDAMLAAVADAQRGVTRAGTPLGALAAGFASVDWGAALGAFSAADVKRCLVQGASL